MSNSKLNDIKKYLGLGARSNKYTIIINKANLSGERINTLCFTTSMPSKNLADIEIWYMGRKLTIAGDTEFNGTWSASFKDNENHTLRREFLDWMDEIDQSKPHTRNINTHADYMGTAILTQLTSSTNKPTFTMNIQDIYPKSISEITYSDDNSGLVEFTVEFNYSTWD